MTDKTTDDKIISEFKEKFPELGGYIESIPKEKEYVFHDLEAFLRKALTSQRKEIIKEVVESVPIPDEADIMPHSFQIIEWKDNLKKKYNP